jgi:hypothetical protein
VTAPKPPALARAVEAIERVRARYYPATIHPADELRAVGPDLLTELADEFRLAGAPRPRPELRDNFRVDL